MTRDLGLRRLTRHAFVGLLLLAALQLPQPLPPVEAAPGTIDPREIALTPADLVPGFAVDPATTRMSPLPDSAGVIFRVDMKRQPTPQALSEGLIMVQQMIVRIDADVPPEMMLAVVRDELVESVGMAPTSDGPNDGGTVSLKRTDGEVTLYSVGFVKGQMVIFTTWGGSATVTTFPKLIELAGISSARLDAVLAQ
jgi:hypothetical protein